MLAQVNPHFAKGAYEWTHNCQRCVVAWELIQRGYDVTAKPIAADSIGSSAVAAWECKSDNWRKDRDLRLVTIKAWFKQKVKEAFEEWGKEARAIIIVKWRDGTQHAFVAKVIENKITYLDPQMNIIRDIDATLKECTDEQRKLWFMRIDNRQFTDAVKDAVRNAEVEK